MPVWRSTSDCFRDTSSETRKPAAYMISSRARSRIPSSVETSGAAKSRLISSSVRNFGKYEKRCGVSRSSAGCLLRCRSEERRVGKECRSRWGPHEEQKEVEDATEA